MPEVLRRVSALLVVADARALPLPDASVDAIVCDPPYDLTSGKRGGIGEASLNENSPAGRARISTGGGGFMGKAWDATGVAFDPATWCEALRVLKPGGHLLAFGGTRRYHRMTVAIEDAGFEVRDCLMWLYGSGFPKSRDVSKDIDRIAGAEREIVGVAVYGDGHVQRSAESIGYGGSDPAVDRRLLTAGATDDARQWEGWGTALKPAWEPIVLARKPLAGTVAANVLTYGTGALDIDGTRIEGGSRPWRAPIDSDVRSHQTLHTKSGATAPDTDRGRWPANLILDEEAAALLDAQTGERPSGAMQGGARYTSLGYHGGGTGASWDFEASTGGASRFFYTAKASRTEREAGLEHLLPPGKRRANHHPTVKPVDLMRWLVRLVTPPGGLVLDPFLGAGSTGMAALDEGMRFVGCDLDPDYVALARARIAHRHVLSPPPAPEHAGTPQPRLL